MDVLFEVTDKTGRVICLPVEQWKHIIIKHPLLANNYENMKETVINPLFITTSSKDDHIHYYHRRYKEKRAYLIVLVKYLNGRGFIISSYYSAKMQP